MRRLLVDSSMESQSQSQLSFAGTAERSVAARTSAAVERGYVHALDGIAQILLEYKVSGQGLKAKAKRAAASNEQKREVVEDIINVFPGEMPSRPCSTAIHLKCLKVSRPPLDRQSAEATTANSFDYFLWLLTFFIGRMSLKGLEALG